MRVWSLRLSLAAILMTLPGAALGQSLMLSARGQVARQAGSTAKGYPAYPLNMLRTLGAKIFRVRDSIVVAFLGDTLRFRPGHPGFGFRGKVIPLPHWSFAPNDVLYLPAGFYTDWLPAQFPDRLRYADGVLMAVDATSVAAGGQTPPSPPTPGPREESRARDSLTRILSRRPASSARRQDSTPSRPTSSSRKPSKSVPDPDSLVSGSLHGFIDSWVSGVFDSNIDHAAVPTASYGTVARLGLGMQTARSNPLLAVRYLFGFYRFTSSERWNRTTHDVSAELAPVLSVFRPRLAGAVRVGSWTEDRELANQLMLRAGLDIRPSRRALVSLRGEQRVRRITGAVERADTSRLAGVALAWRFGRGGRWEIEGRYESNRSERPSSRYLGWSGRTSVQVPVTKADQLGLELAYRQRDFSEHPVEGADEETLRRDRRWTPTASLTHDLGGGYWSVVLEYELERNRSNEAESSYLAHRLALGIRRRL